MKSSSGTPKSRASHVGVSFNNTALVKARLQDEITQLERQLQSMRLSDQGANFAMLESFKEMINSRREMLASLPPSS